MMSALRTGTQWHGAIHRCARPYAPALERETIVYQRKKSDVVFINSAF
jgi:hypothetical protein